MNQSRRIAVALLILVASIAGTACTKAEQPPTFVGSAACASCHAKEHTAWQESNHRHAMEPPTAQAVLGDFNNAQFTYFGRTTRFFKDGDSFRISTENQKGETQTFKVAYTLGYKPLQQYLVDVGGGRIQALPFAWDGKQWFHLYPKENVKPDNPLFWTRPLQNWNHMCGDCHTTGFAKNASADGASFSSQWSETGNGCESCHGPGSLHVNKKAPLPRLVGQKAEINQCGACHARRTRLKETPMDTMLETWRPQPPHEGLYFVDGQIRDEVFEIGSFLQSKMAAKGVRCTDCHDPHTARLRASGNALCTQCHNPGDFDTPEHHLHEAGTAAAQCVNCHMPERTYMVVDPRRDHRFAIPRPDLSDKLGTPNACVGCHKDRSNTWAAEILRKKHGARSDTWGVLAWEAAREQRPAEEILKSLSNGPNASANPIAKAAIVASIKTWTPEAIRLFESQKDPMVKLGRGAPESRDLLLRNVDRAEAMAELAALQIAEGKIADAKASFEKAMQRDDTSLTVLLNFADFHRAQGNDSAAEPLLLRATALYPEAPGARLALGLLRVRQMRTPEGMKELARAAQLAPDDSHYAYVYAVGLYSTGEKQKAIAVLKSARERFPANAEIAAALEAYSKNNIFDSPSRAMPRRDPRLD